MYDVVVIGAGVVGASLTRLLSKYKLSVLCLEKNDDVCCVQSKANSAIVHQGFDPIPKTLKAKLNVEGAKLFPSLVRDLSIPFKKCGALVVKRKGEDIKSLYELKDRADRNKARPVIIIKNKNHIKSLEKNLADDIDAVLFAPSSAVINPFLLTIRMCESAKMNGVAFKFNSQVINIEKLDGFYKIKTINGIYESKCVINAAGIYSDIINDMVSQKRYNIQCIRGDYLVMHKSQNNKVSRTIFALPSQKGKGILVTPSTDGNLLLGPTSYHIDDRDDCSITQVAIDEIKQKTALNVKNIDYKKVIRMFSGVRSHENGGDFIIEEAQGCPNFINLIGIESPGLTAAPAIAEYVIEKYVSKIFDLGEKKNWKRTIKVNKPFDQMSLSEKKSAISRNPYYKNIICKCENVTEAEVRDSIERVLGAVSVDGVKKRTRCAMGICQGGYCKERIEKILKELCHEKV